jgi:hypothetical protein
MDRYLAQLKSADAAVRRQAIIAIGRGGTGASLPALAEVFRTDPDPDLRELARKAGLAIRKRETGGAPPPPSSPQIDMPDTDLLLAGTGAGGQSVSAFTVDLDEVDFEALAPFRASSDDDDSPDLDSLVGRATAAAALAGTSVRGLDALEKQQAPRTAADDIEDQLKGRAPVPGRTYNVPREVRDRAKQAVESALSLNMRGENAKALKLLTEALSLDPNLINDKYFESIAASVTGLDGHGAMRVIIDKGERSNFVQVASKKQKQERKEKHVSETKRTGWGALSFELVLYFLIATFGTFFGFLVIGQALLGSFGDFSANEVFVDALPVQPDALANGFSVPALLLFSLITGVTTIIGFLIQMAGIHVVATLLLGGKGTYTNMSTEVARVQIRWQPLLYIMAYVTIAMIFISQASPVVLCFVLPIVGVSLYLQFQTLQRIGQAYDFSVVMGCLAFVISYVLLSLLSTGLVTLLGSTLGNLLTNFVSR